MPVEIRPPARAGSGHIYNPDDFRVLEKLDAATRHKIRTGDRRGYKSRSERDWAVVLHLSRSGATDALITFLFANTPIGDKVRDETTAAGYLDHTIEAVRNKAQPEQPGPGVFEEREDGYYISNRRTERRVSTFVIDPKLLLDGSLLNTDDAIVGDVRSAGHVWKDIAFTRSAFTSLLKLDRESPKAAWQWLGKDDDVRHLLPYLMEKLQSRGLPRVIAAPALGLHRLGEQWYFVGDKAVLSASETWPGYSGPIGWLPSRAEHPELDLSGSVTNDELARLGEFIPKLNEPEVLWVILGWYAATALKPWLETKGYRFPILNVSGTRGSGKTSAIQRVFMPLFGQSSPKSYDAGTTRFVMLSCLGSTTAVPIAFSEFRYDSVEKFLRYILLSYDSGHDPRGRADQSTVDYILSAPFSVDGEDLIADPAARERIVVAALHPATVVEGGVAYEAYKQLVREGIPNFGGYYVRYLLQRLSTGDIDDLLDDARRAIVEAFPQRLPDRVRNNHVVAYLGTKLWCDAVGLPCPDAKCMERSIRSVYNLESGRARTLADDFIEDVVNAVPTNYFRYQVNPGGLFLFQLSSTHTWWIASRRRQGRTALERDAIQSQLKESPYYVDTVLQDGVFYYSIDLKKAQEAGLDLSTEVIDRSIHF